MNTLNSQNIVPACKPSPQVEMLFRKPELAQKAASALTNAKFNTSKVAINKMFFEDGGRRLILKLSSSGACPSDLLAFVCAVVDAASIARPLLREISIPLVQDSAVAL